MYLYRKMPPQQNLKVADLPGGVSHGWDSSLAIQKTLDPTPYAWDTYPQSRVHKLDPIWTLLHQSEWNSDWVTWAHMEPCASCSPHPGEATSRWVQPILVLVSRDDLLSSRMPCSPTATRIPISLTCIHCVHPIKFYPDMNPRPTRNYISPKYL